MTQKKIPRRVAVAVAEEKQRRVDERVAEVALRLRRAADAVEYHGARGEYGRIVHEATWTLAHLDFGGLLGDVAELREFTALAEARDRMEDD